MMNCLSCILKRATSYFRLTLRHHPNTLTSLHFLVTGTACAAILAGCGHRTASGVYVQHNDRAAMLLQLTQTPDQHLTGSLQFSVLNSDGALEKKVWNVDGVIDDDRLTLTVRAPELLAQSLNIGGKLADGGIDLNMPTTSIIQKVGVQHLVKGNVSDYDDAVNTLAVRGNRDRQLVELNQAAAKLAADLNQFVDHAKGHWVGKGPGVQSYFNNAIQQEHVRLDKAHRLLQVGGPVYEAQAEVVRDGMDIDYINIENVYSKIDQVRHTEIEQEQALVQRMTSFEANCLDPKDVRPGQLIPDMGPCKALEQAVYGFKALLSPIHGNMDELVKIKVTSKQSLDSIKNEMDSAFKHR